MQRVPLRPAVQLRVRGRTRPWWLTAAYVAALVPAGQRPGAGWEASVMM
jgi:hypothetical protein